MQVLEERQVLKARVDLPNSEASKTRWYSASEVVLDVNAAQTPFFWKGDDPAPREQRDVSSA